MAYTGHRSLVLPKPSRDLEQILILSNVLRRSTSTEKYPNILLRLDILKGHIGLDRITLPFLGYRPPRFHLMHDHLINPFLGSCDDRLIPALDQPVIGIQRIDGLRCVSNNDQYLVPIHVPFPFDSQAGRNRRGKCPGC